MVFFIDTNVALGYSIIPDKWHDRSKEFFEENVNEDIFWSNLVKKEYSDKSKIIINSVMEFLQKIQYLLEINNQEFLNNYEFEKFVMAKTEDCDLDSFKRRKILQLFCDNYDLNFIDNSCLSSKFELFSHLFFSIYIDFDYKLNNYMLLHDCGLDNYLKYADYSKILNYMGIHSPDCKIVIDAHDLSLKSSPVTFVSFDEKLIRILMEMDTSFLKIYEFNLWRGVN